MSSGPRILIAIARFYDDIADELLRGAQAAIEDAGGTTDVVDVPGAFEIPAAIRIAHMADNGAGYDGFVALGCVVRGETSHYEYVCGESARGLQDLAITHGLAIGYGILTVENREQAWARAAIEQKDKGGEAARACLEMISSRRRFGLS